MMDHNSIIQRQVQALNSLNDSIPTLEKEAMTQEQLQNIINNQLFSPAEDETIAYWFARFITIRRNLWAIVDTAIANTKSMAELSATHDWHYFVIAYSAVCSLVRIDRFLLNVVAYDSIIQRKLNEAFPEHRIERKQCSAIYAALTLPANAIRINEAHRTFKKKHKLIAAAVKDTSLQAIFEKLPEQERYMDLRWYRYLWARLCYRHHSWRRRGASARQQSLFAFLELSGRLVSELCLPGDKKVTKDVRTQLHNILQPGDIFVTRHNGALTNLFLPGFWPHAALYVGYESHREQLDIKADPRHLRYWHGDHCTFEALKDGVHFRPLQETLNVDAFVILRTHLPQTDIAQAIARVIVHAGKGYNFDFDFFRSDQLVCTEVIYRAFDGINDVNIPLIERVGRKTLSAEDLLDMALDTLWLSPVAIYGVGSSKEKIVTGDDVRDILVNSYRN